jgi:hypothetical protein
MTVDGVPCKVESRSLQHLPALNRSFIDEMENAACKQQSLPLTEGKPRRFPAASQAESYRSTP